MVAVLIFLTLVTSVTLVQSQGETRDGSRQATNEKGTSSCRLRGSIVVEYNISEYDCYRCPGKGRKLLHRRAHIPKKEICQKVCFGVICKSQCIRIQRSGVAPSCIGGRAVSRYGGDPEDGHEKEQRGSQVPLIIGFTIGGILLAIVMAGIFLGRQQRPDNAEGSENPTTPVSLSNSEWHSNAGSGSTRRREENLRVQEASTEDLTMLPESTFEGFPDNKDCRKDENANEFFLKSEEDESSIAQESYMDPFSTEYQRSEDVVPISNRSSEVVLEDGYVTGGNFVGSADPQVQHLLNHNGHSSPTENGRVEQTFFDGKTPGSMTHEAICMSLTHSAHNYAEVEYVIEDQDFMEFGEPIMISMTEQQTVTGKPQQTMQVDLEYRDIDSDFEDHNSQPNSADKSDNGDVFFTASNSTDHRREHQALKSDSISTHPDSPLSESGIEASYQSKESCEVPFKTGNSKTLLNSSTSWNDNCKGHLRRDDGVERQRIFKTNSASRSKSCTWKSPSAPTHSSSRQPTFPIHCPSSEPAYSRPRHSHLTHVFVDVHRNMASSEEDLLAHAQTSSKQNHRKPSATDSESSFGQVYPNETQVTPQTFFSESPVNQDRKQRNKSMYVLRNGDNKRPHKWTPRTVRFSSGGSGEYAIPFGSLVP